MKLFIFGSTGDLVKRKIVPAFVELNSSGEASNLNNLEIIALGRREFTDEMYHGFICNGECFKNFKIKPKYKKVEFGKYIKCEDCDDHLSKTEPNYFYSAMPPKNTEQIIQYLGRIKGKGFKVKALIEKPFGVSLKEAVKLKELAKKYKLTDDILISDHYLFKEEVLPLKPKDFKKVKIVSLESVGLEKRISYYDEAGALQDMVQSHFLNIAFKLLQNPEKELGEIEVLEYIRGQYGDGKLKGYVKDLGKHSETETSCHIYFRAGEKHFEFVTGKKFDKKLSYIEIDGKKIHFNSEKNPYSRLFQDFFADRKESFATLEQSILGWQVANEIEKKKPELKYYDEETSADYAANNKDYYKDTK
ncbi:MAG: hypothetical protein WCT19_00680 [Candidatus Paceibacterota bacterium]|jgi:glucose-6-phosphate 1-dehydrogenase